jgi:hypothetical protein
VCTALRSVKVSREQVKVLSLLILRTPPAHLQTTPQETGMTKVMVSWVVMTALLLQVDSRSWSRSSSSSSSSSYQTTTNTDTSKLQHNNTDWLNDSDISQQSLCRCDALHAITVTPAE